MICPAAQGGILRLAVPHFFCARGLVVSRAVLTRPLRRLSGARHRLGAGCCTPLAPASRFTSFRGYARSRRSVLRFLAEDNLPFSADHASASTSGCVRSTSYACKTSLLTRGTPAPLGLSRFRPRPAASRALPRLRWSRMSRFPRKPISAVRGCEGEIRRIRIAFHA